MSATKTASEQTTSKETWRDWMPQDSPNRNPEQLFTREEVAANLKILGIAISPSDLRYWEGQGILPRGVRKRHKGATRSVYPRWYLPLVIRLKQLQAVGYTLAQIKTRIRAQANFLMGAGTDVLDQHLRDRYKVWVAPYEHFNEHFNLPELIASGMNPEEVSELASKYMISAWDLAVDPESMGITWELRRQLQEQARLVERFNGVPTKQIEITFIDEEGGTVRFSAPGREFTKEREPGA